MTTVFIAAIGIRDGKCAIPTMTPGLDRASSVTLTRLGGIYFPA
ncbi:hypothetical protein [Mesorhizobium sp. B2-8-3]|nr:hypothetical protein [Mesorhizobium sp. B2-8-3]